MQEQGNGAARRARRAAAPQSVPVEVRVRASGSEGTVLSARCDWLTRKAESAVQAKSACWGLRLAAVAGWFRR
ncbi:hypothetical protein MY4824_002091 [Beauveria thailandica]